ncbi:MAG: hypothetical protein K2W95_33425 [Candidatus Obscuribacterales bacterium]|nr:hypothetical protein [Candidatus Obscuribacterales bacterium]
MPSNAPTGTHTDTAPPLTAKLSPWMSELSKQPQLLKQWLETHGSPLHVVNGEEFRRNVHDLLSVFKPRGLTGGLYFARKANKLPWFVKLALEEGIGVDTASLDELRETLALGVAPDKIVVTALGKDRALVDTAVSAGCLLIIDNEDEFALLRESTSAVGKPARVGLRFAGYVVSGRKVFSRFGFPVSNAHEVIAKVLESTWLKLECFHAHLDRYDTVERATAARQLIALVDHCAERNTRVGAIDLGGGILMRYIEDQSQWKTFVTALTDSVQGKRPFFTYRHDGLGYHRAGDTVVGTADLYPVWNGVSKERFLAAILDYEESGSPLFKELSSRGLKLYFEPGRALLDNTGLTLAKVVFRKRDTDGNLLIGVGMNRTNLRPFRAEFCSDPLLISSGGERAALNEGAYIVGCLCGEADVIYKRKLRLPFMPEMGDTVVFVNSAGYLAHHMEIGTHGNPLPRNVLFEPSSQTIKAVFPEQ